MNQKEKRLLCVIILILILLAAVILTHYYFQLKQLQEQNAPDPSEVAEAMSGKELTGGYRCVTTQSEESETTDNSKTVVSKTFTHKLFNPEGKYLAVLKVSVVGNISDGEASVTSVSCKLSDEQTEGLTVSEHLSGDTGTVVLYLNQLSVCHLQYRIYSDRSVELL